MEVHWFAVSKLQVRGQLCYPGHVVSFYQVFTRLNIWSLAKQRFKQTRFMFSRLNTWITTLPLYRFFFFPSEACLLYQKVLNSPNTRDKLQQVTLQFVTLMVTLWLLMSDFLTGQRTDWRGKNLPCFNISSVWWRWKSAAEVNNFHLHENLLSLPNKEEL